MATENHLFYTERLNLVGAFANAGWDTCSDKTSRAANLIGFLVSLDLINTEKARKFLAKSLACPAKLIGQLSARAGDPACQPREDAVSEFVQVLETEWELYLRYDHSPWATRISGDLIRSANSAVHDPLKLVSGWAITNPDGSSDFVPANKILSVYKRENRLQVPMCSAYTHFICTEVYECKCGLVHIVSGRLVINDRLMAALLDNTDAVQPKVYSDRVRQLMGQGATADEAKLMEAGEKHVTELASGTGVAHPQGQLSVCCQTCLQDVCICKDPVKEETWRDRAIRNPLF